MLATLFNLSPMDRDSWAVVTFPTRLTKSFPNDCGFHCEDGRVFRAIKGKTQGKKTVFRIYCYGIRGNEAVTGKLVPEKAYSAEPFRFHPWVSDDLTKLVPKFQWLEQFGGPEYGMSIIEGPTLLEHSAAHQRWRLRMQDSILGTVAEYWADILHDDPVVKWKAAPVWSNRNDPSWNKLFQNIGIDSGEMMVVDFAKRHGVQAPVKNGAGDWRVVLNDRPLNLNDGSGLPLSGVMVCYDNIPPFDLPKDWEDMNDPIARSLRNIQSAVAGWHGDVVGVSHDWDGEACANLHAPRFDASYVSRRQVDWEAFDRAMGSTAGWFTARPLAIGRRPSGTGDQEDFGACKGAYAITELDPRHIAVLQYSVYSEYFRGACLYETNGTRVDEKNHPNWNTWSGITHFHGGVSPDRLGKPTQVPPGTGWEGYDDEHHSQNSLAIYSLLTDDPLTDEFMFHQLNIDKAAYRTRFPQNGQGATRAQGRTVGAFAQLATVCDERIAPEFIKLVRDRSAQSARIPTLTHNKPMKVLSVFGVDGRKNTFINGVRSPSVSCWEHGLALVGFYKAWKITGDPNIKFIIEQVSSFLKKFGFFLHNSQWYTVDDIAWNGGDETGTGLGEHVVANPGMPGTGSWTFAGLLIAAEMTGADESLKSYIRAMTGGKEARVLRDAEWWAAVRSIPALLV